MKSMLAALALSLVCCTEREAPPPATTPPSGHTLEEHRQFVIDSVLFLNQVNEILVGVTDVPSAEAARPKLDALVDALLEIKARRKVLGPVPDALRTADEEFARNQKEVFDRWQGVNANIGRILKIQGGIQALGPSMSKILTFFSDQTPG